MTIDKIHDLLGTAIFYYNDFKITLFQVILATLLFVGIKLLLKGIRKFIEKSDLLTRGNVGAHHALFQLIKYIVWVLAIVAILEILGIGVTFLLAGSAALLVGVGLGLQQTFNDIISGVILLLEGSIHIDDVIEIDGKVYKVVNIGLRTSDVIDRDEIVCIVPNSKIVTDKVINWSHDNNSTRFRIKIGVAYGTDPELVSQILEKSAHKHPLVLETPKPQVIFSDFGDSSLNFDLLFWSNELFRIEQVKSDIRKEIVKNFKAENITIPFPQRDIHLVSSNIQNS